MYGKCWSFSDHNSDGVFYNAHCFNDNVGSDNDDIQIWLRGRVGIMAMILMMMVVLIMLSIIKKIMLAMLNMIIKTAEI